MSNLSVRKIETQLSTLVALKPSDMPAQQAQLVAWCRQRLIELGHELKLQREALRATGAKFARGTFGSKIRTLRAEMIYYSKIKAALEAGYLIVPNFDLDIFAVRTSREHPPNKRDKTAAQPDLSAPGRGRYVDDVTFSDTRSETYTDSYEKKEKTRHFEVPTYYDSRVGIPNVHPLVLSATERAMALRIFDQIGVVKARKQDPIIAGQIVSPKNNSYYWKKTVSFFIAWWLDPKTL